MYCVHPRARLNLHTAEPRALLALFEARCISDNRDCFIFCESMPTTYRNMVVLIVIESITRDNMKMMRMRQRHEAVDLGGGIGEYHPIELGFKIP